MPRPSLPILAVLTLVGAVPLRAQSVDELVAKHIEARGGLQALRAIETVRVTGTMTIGPGIEAPITLEMKRPGRMRMEFTFQGMTGIQAYDGEHGWQLMPFGGRKDPEPMGPEELKEAEEQADLDGPLVDYAAKGHAVEYVGTDTIEGAETHKLKITLKNGDVRYAYLDGEYFLILREEGKRVVRGSEVETETSFGDFKQVAQVMFAHSIDGGIKGRPERQKLVIDKIEVNVPVDDARFVMPAPAAETQPQTQP
jgi:outer membrane lipoprotein-sorting protein